MEEDIAEIPHYKYYFATFKELEDKVDQIELLSDVIGVVTIVQDLEKSTLNSRITSCRNVTIKNVENKELQVTLWGHKTDLFDDNVLKTLEGPVVTIFTSVLVKKSLGKPRLSSTTSTLFFVNPNIPKVEDLKTRFQEDVKTIKFLPSAITTQSSLNEEKKENRKTLVKLLEIRPKSTKDMRFTVKAVIVDICEKDGWYYMACPNCMPPVSQADVSWWCQKDSFINKSPLAWYKLNTIISNQTGKMRMMIYGRVAEYLIKEPCIQLVTNHVNQDKRKFPQAIIDVIGKYKIFQIAFETKAIDNVAICKKVFDDETSEATNNRHRLSPPINPKTPDPKVSVNQR
ncbi:uncharacterized protein LOC133825647 [Humulus lupulus]|uniref:uncharacterized protein LOC133825647 n=1 Tax=Humulus lupulus TaxID=3486 RepID=UPI002B40420F|nr:uncharacterized protein LOC133825647 [Humulus lupulus]